MALCGSRGRQTNRWNPATWTAYPISGDQEGIKSDLLQLIDLDQDGDLNVLTCEKRDNLGVIWYENPSR